MGLLSRRTSAKNTDAAALAAWQELARRLTPDTPDATVAEFVRAVARLTGAVETEPLFRAGVTDQLPADARMVVLAGALGSGKTVCGRRLVRQAIAAGRHVTVIRTCNGWGGSDEYAFADLTPDQLTVIDAHTLTSEDARSLLSHHLVYEGTASEMVIVDAHVPLDALRALAKDLHRQWLVTRPHATLVVLTLDTSDLSDSTVDTRIVLPGPTNTAFLSVGQLRALHIDDLTWMRLAARINGGGIAGSKEEASVLGWFAHDGDVYTALAQHQTQIHEQPMPTTPKGQLQHGVLQRPDGALAEFALPPTAD